MNNNTNISERISYMIDLLKVNPNNFAKKLGYARSQAIYDMLDGKSKPSFDFFEKLLNSEYSEFMNIDWLITGNGEMLKSKSAELVIINNDNLNDNFFDTKPNVQKMVSSEGTEKPNVQEMLHFESVTKSVTNEKHKKSYTFEGIDSFKESASPHLIPLYDGVVVGGTVHKASLDPQTEPAEYINAGDWFRDASAAMRVHGDSMFPEYKSGSIVALKEVNNKMLVIYGQVYLIETEEYRVIKRLQRSTDKQSWLLASINTEIWESGDLMGRQIHEPFDVPIDAVRRIYRILGCVTRTESSRIVFNEQAIKK